jgi:hypothetical protein
MRRTGVPEDESPVAEVLDHLAHVLEPTKTEADLRISFPSHLAGF